MRLMFDPFKAIGFCYRLRSPADAPRSGRWVHTLAPMGLAVGLALAGLTALCWGRWHLKDYGLWMAVLPMLLVYWLGPAAVRMLGFARTFAHLRRRERLNAATSAASADWDALGLYILALAAAVATYYFAIATMPTDAPAGSSLPRWLASLLRPRKLYAAIALMAVWGNASMLLAALMSRPAAHADAMVRQLLAAPVWVKLLWGWVAPTALSAGLFAGWWLGGWASAVALGAMMFGLMMLVCWLLARRGQGHCRQTLLAAAMLGEVAFLLIFHALVK